MKGRNLIVALMALAVLLVGCSSTSTDNPLLETQWVLVAMEGNPPLTGTAPSAEFSADQISGSAGCNHYFGTVAVKGSDITISDIESTEMYCMDPQGVMDQEQAFLAALASAVSYQLTESQLELLDAADRVILAFELLSSVTAVPESGKI